MAPGVVLGGKYRLEYPIGQGGMGEVWRARRLDLDADVAVKVMNVGASRDKSALSRFNREARAAAGLRSPHVVQIFDFGVDELTSTPFIAMELLEGESLRERLGREKALPAAVVCEIVAQIGRALTRAHAAQIVHRDLKPDNVFMVANEDQVLVKLLDFGIAKAELVEGDGLATATGVVLGTPYYMSPEQLQGARGVDLRTDLWSLGVIACECITGSRPFSAGTLAELAMKIALGRSAKPSSLGPVPVGFDEWFARSTEVEPERRFQSAAELVAALRAVLRETRLVGSASAPPALSTTQDSDSLSSQTAAARAFVEPPTTHAASERKKPRRVPLYVLGALALLGTLVGIYGRSFLQAPEPAASGAAPASALPAAPVQTLAAPPASAASSILAAPAPSALHAETPATPAASAERASKAAASEAATDKATTGKAAASKDRQSVRRAKSARRAKPAPSAANDGVNAFDVQ